MALDPKNLNIVLLIDKSTSMDDPVKKGSSVKRWTQAKEIVRGFAKKAAEFDDDGIDVCFFAGTTAWKHNVTEDQVDDLFRTDPAGSTDTALAIKEAGEKHFERKRKGDHKSTLIACFTDGDTDRKSLEAEIAAITRKVDNADEVSIGFFQIGDDRAAETLLRGLDEKVAGATRDIVKSLTAAEMEQYDVAGLIRKILEH